MNKIFNTSIGPIQVFMNKFIVDNKFTIYLKDVKEMTYYRFSALGFIFHRFDPYVIGQLVITLKNKNKFNIGIKYKYVKQFPKEVLSKIDISL